MRRILFQIPRALLRTGKTAVQRLTAHGTRSASVYLQTQYINLALRVRNRLGATPKVECPCCGWKGLAFRSLDCGQFIVPQAECPHCRGHERHRFLHLFFTRRPPAFLTQPGRILHFAPEQSIRRFIDQNEGAHCIATDYAKGIYQEILSGVPDPRLISDLHHMPLAEGSIHGSICLHVLEHVDNDREAIQNLHRITAPGGEALIMVPFMMDQTETEEYDQPDPELFDHVRGYSPLDFKDRLTPFVYEEITPSTLLSPDEIDRFQIPDSQVIYCCRKEEGQHD